MRKTIVAGNWKMNGTRESIKTLLDAITDRAMKIDGLVTLVCPPAVYLSQVVDQIADAPVAVGAQNVSEQSKGAYTGEWSLEMLQDLGCKYVILGHSERRSLFGESDELVAEKVAATLEAGLVPVLCVGETLGQREAGDALVVVNSQISATLQRIGIEGFASVVVAYEPVWAIGTGLTATPGDAQEVHAAIRAQLAEKDAIIADNLSILYGGSMNAANAAELLAQQDIDGGLIGGASLKADEFLTICAAAAESRK
ncbi:triose-phosphate isomerase [Amphritea japonica]|uniref:Triosephosphate isomerase n=1 Tax=Amphritea japonica ATCC BAA-1530 TaxID=1278309 RepID=A0A7R6SUH1_9GAMM|nr:triose-phosphate isomerase [Amphritea japonica]BBB27705.1 triosephosphate isomerase [Amphritea japonica ATCC BAA-1530]